MSISINTFKSCYIVGIGGSGMSSIAKYLFQKGLEVSGYDQRSSYITNLLNNDGIKVDFDISNATYSSETLYIVSSAINMESTFLSDFHNNEELLEYFDSFNTNLSKKTLNSYLKSVSNQ